jgi:nucleoside-diphosphate-sugar epimerase
MKALVTGGGGFLGGALARRLVAHGDEVRSFARRIYPQLAAFGIRQFQGDLSEPRAIGPAVAGCDVIFHVAAKAGIWGPYRDYYRTNVLGTENILAACHQHGVGRLVYTSSPSVVYTGADHCGIDESAPYPRRFLAHYPRTKSEAERSVLAASGTELATVALRPHLIWGPGDPHLLPRLVSRSWAGRLPRVGNGQNRVDSTYIDNAVDAHLLAAERLRPGAPIAGKAYFLAQGEPMPLWQFIDRLLEAAGAPLVKGAVPASAAYALGAFLEAVYGALGISREPIMTRFLALQFATSHWFDLTAAKRDLGYVAAVSVDEGLRRLREQLRDSAKGAAPQDFDTTAVPGV